MSSGEFLPPPPVAPAAESTDTSAEREAALVLEAHPTTARHHISQIATRLDHLQHLDVEADSEENANEELAQRRRAEYARHRALAEVHAPLAAPAAVAEPEPEPQPG